MSALKAGDIITVAAGGELHTHVVQFSIDTIDTADSSGANEGIDWLPGRHAADSETGQALLAAHALTRDEGEMPVPVDSSCYGIVFNEPEYPK